MDKTSTKMVNRLRLKHLALLVAIAESGSLKQAAAIVSIAQPSASKILADIEETFGFAIFERGSRGMSMTALGAEVVGYAGRCLRDLERFAESLHIKEQGGYGLLTVGVIMGAAPDILARAVTDLKVEQPRLHVRILGETSDQVVKLLHTREVDLAVGRFTDPLQHNEFDFEPLAKESLRLVVRAKHSLAARRTLKLAQLIDWPWIVQPISTPARQILEEEFAHAGLSTPSNIVECSSVFATLQLIQSCDAVGMMPESVVRDYLKARVLVELPVALGDDLRGFGLLTRKAETCTAPALRFTQLLRHYSTKKSSKN